MSKGKGNRKMPAHKPNFKEKANLRRMMTATNLPPHAQRKRDALLAANPKA